MEGRSPDRPRTGRESLGDRVERAIEHADVEHEIERGEAEPRPRRRLRRTVVLARGDRRLAVPGRAEPARRARLLAGPRRSRAGLAGGDGGAAGARRWPACGRSSTWRCPGPGGRVITSQLAGNALAKVAPGGGAVGAALQYRMLVQAGLLPARTSRGSPRRTCSCSPSCSRCRCSRCRRSLRGAVDRDLLEAALIGLAVFVALFGVGASCCCHRPAAGLGRARRCSACATGCAAAPSRCAAARAAAARARPHHRHPRPALEARAAGDRRALGVRLRARCSPRWRRSARTPRPGLVLLAFCAAQLLAQIPVTPGRPRLRRGRA